jgi:ankyrin repeat protein
MIDFIPHNPQASCRFLQEGRTPLHEAAWRDREEVVDLLLRKGADRQAKDKVHFRERQRELKGANIRRNREIRGMMRGCKER